MWRLLEGDAYFNVDTQRCGAYLRATLIRGPEPIRENTVIRFKNFFSIGVEYFSTPKRKKNFSTRNRNYCVVSRCACAMQLIYLFTYLFIYLLIYSFIYLFICLFICLFIYFIYLFALCQRLINYKVDTKMIILLVQNYE